MYVYLVSLGIYVAFVVIYRKAAKPIIRSCYMRLNCTMLFREGVCVWATNRFNFTDCYTIICVVTVAILTPCSWYCKHQMVWHWWWWKYSCHWFAWAKPWRSFCLLWPEVLTEDSLDARRSDGNNTYFYLLMVLKLWKMQTT